MHVEKGTSDKYNDKLVIVINIQQLWDNISLSSIFISIRDNNGICKTTDFSKIKNHLLRVILLVAYGFGIINLNLLQDAGGFGIKKKNSRPAILFELFFIIWIIKIILKNI